MSDQPVEPEAFVDRDLRGAVFDRVDLRDVRMRNVYLGGTRIRGAWATEPVELDGGFSTLVVDGEVGRLVVNGVDVTPYVEAELDRRDPDRTKMQPQTAHEYRAAWEVVERRWAATVERARGLDPALLHERVDGEWSFVETLRHLVMATDAWFGRAYGGNPRPYHPLGLPHDEMGDVPGVPHDRDARPDLDEVLGVRADRMAAVRAALADLTDERLDEMTEPVLEPGYPESESFPVRRCLGAVVHEEWAHRQFAERDLDVLTAR